MRGVIRITLAALCIAASTAAASAEDAVTPANPPSQVNLQVGDVEYRLPFDLPTRESIVRAMPALEPNETIQKIECELISFERGAARHFPHAGMASLYNADYRCTMHTDQRTLVVYMNYDRLVLAE